MGAWGLGSFDNDDAADWVLQLEQTSDTSLLSSAFDLGDGYIESPDGCIALAAAEVVLAMLGKARSGLPRIAVDWSERVATLPESSNLRGRALTAVQQLLSEQSELRELWEEGDDYAEWKRDLEHLVKQLASD